MKFEETFPALREGKKIKHRENFYFIKKEGDRTYLFRNKECNYYSQFDTDHLLSEDWEIVEEPNPKVKYYPALMRYKDVKYLYLSSKLFKNEKEAKDILRNDLFIRLITEIPELIEEREE